MKFFQRYRIVITEIGLVFLLSLIPLLWFKPGCLISGGDIDFPLEPVRCFVERINTWNPMALGGTDRSMDITRLFFTGVEVFFYKLTDNLIVTEKLTFILWFFLIGISGYFFLRMLFPYGTVIHKVGILLWCLNFYQLHIWEIVRLGEGSAAIVIPPLLALFIRERNLVKVSLWVILFSFLGGGIGIQPPMIGILLFALLSYFLFNYKKLPCNFVRLIITISLFVTINAYWILPEINYILKSGYTAGTAETVFNVPRLLEWCSRYNSILNVFRLYGDVFWFDKWKGVTYLPFFDRFQANSVLILASFGFPLLAFSSILFSKGKKILYFSLLALLTIFLGKGVHPPFEEINIWLYKNIPGFWIFRAPWQKFGLLQMLSYVYLSLITLDKIFKFLYKVYKPALLSLIVCIVIFQFGYNYPLILGKMFPTSSERKGLDGFHQKFPDYIFKAADWINSKTGDFRVIPLPDERVNVYKWGYGAPKDIILDIFHKGLVFRQYGEGTAPPNSLDGLYNLIIRLLYSDMTKNICRLTQFLNVKFILLRNDFIYDFYGDTDSPEFVKERLHRQNNIEFTKSFGEWDFYELKVNLPKIYIADSSIGLPDNLDVLAPLSYTSFFDNKPVFLSFVSGVETDKTVTFNGTKLDSSKLAIFLDKKGLGRIDVMEGGEYYIMGRLVPNKVQVETVSLKGEVVPISDIERWAHSSVNAVYEYKIDNYGVLNIVAVFDGNEKEDEYICLKNNNLNIDLLKQPYFILNYNVEYPDFQTIEIVFGVDINGDNITDEYIRGVYPKPAASELNNFYYDVLGNIRKMFPDRKSYVLRELEIYPHKLWGRDCSIYKGRKYNFYIADVYFGKVDSRECIKETRNDIAFLSSIDDYRSNGDLLAVDEERITKNLQFNNDEEIIFRKKMHLEKGEHVIKDLLGEGEKGLVLQWLVLEPVSASVIKTDIKLDYQMLDPTRYLVKVEDADFPFWLVFSESYHPDWKAYVIQNNKRVELTRHYLVNGFANGWHINEIRKRPMLGHGYHESEIRNNKLEILIEYTSQRLFRLGLCISGITILGGFLYLIGRRTTHA